MNRAMLYPALLFLISPLFGADADYSAMFGSDKLKAASAAYEKFGYVSPLVELAKTDAAARKKLDELVADLKSKSEKSSYARDRLANIYFLAGDRAQFEKVANPDFAEAVFSAPDKIYPKLDAAAYYAVFGNSPRDLYDVIHKLCNAGMGNFAVKLWESDAFFKSSNTWDAVNAYQCLIGNGYADISKDRLIKFVQKNSGADNISSIAFLYAITLEDPKYSEEHAFAKKAMDSLPAARQASELRNAFIGLRMSKYAAEQTEKLYELGNLRPYDRLSLIAYWIFGTGERFTNKLPASFLENPNREKAVKLMEESLTQTDFNISEIYCWLIQYYTLAGTPEKTAPLLEKLSSVLTDSYEIRSIATSLLAGTNGYPKDEKLAESFLSRLTENEKANAYLDIARNLKYDSSVSPKRPKNILRCPLRWATKPRLRSLPKRSTIPPLLRFSTRLTDRLRRTQKASILPRTATGSPRLRRSKSRRNRATTTRSSFSHVAPTRAGESRATATPRALNFPSLRSRFFSRFSESTISISIPPLSR